MRSWFRWWPSTTTAIDWATAAGNYDRALPLASPDAAVVGIAFEEQRVTSVPMSEYDVRIPVISA